MHFFEVHVSKRSQTSALRAREMTAFPFPFEPAPDELSIELSIVSLPCIYMYDSHKKRDLID